MNLLDFFGESTLHIVMGVVGILALASIAYNFWLMIKLRSANKILKSHAKRINTWADNLPMVKEFLIKLNERAIESEQRMFFIPYTWIYLAI